MLETLSGGFELFMQYGLPVLPYASISLVIYYMMNWVIKPIIASNRDASGYHRSKGWRIARKGYKIYPMLLGYLASLALPDLLWGYCVVAGVCAQAWYYILYMVRSKLQEKGFKMPPSQDLGKSMMVPPVSEDE